jgi:hypothetical protein
MPPPLAPDQGERVSRPEGRTAEHGRPATGVGSGGQTFSVGEKGPV